VTLAGACLRGGPAIVARDLPAYNTRRGRTAGIAACIILRMSDADLAALRDKLVCPICGSPFGPPGGGQLACSRSDHRFPIRDGVPLLAVLDSRPDAATGSGEPKPAEDYQRQYEEIEAAAKYNEEYRKRALKRLSTRREYQLLERLLSSQPRSPVLLEIPCGGGRVTPALAPHADLLVEADIGLGQVLYGRKTSTVSTPQLWMTASAHHIPFADASVHGIVCVRLCHHLPKPEQREQLVAELLRVASRFVIMTFFDYHSLKNLGRRAREPFDRKPPKCTMRVDEVAVLANHNGARLVEYPALSWIGSGHRYALMVKE
jgi:SAM-dependent methyltransferase/uncharacterized protein YbaR (Trm112 family)